MVPTSSSRPARRCGPVRRQWRWAVVLIGIVGLLLLPSVVAAWPVDDPDVDLPTLLARIDTSGSQPFEGLFESRGGVRVPDLGRYEDQVAMFTQTTRVRVWYATADRWRADELTAGGETGWYREPGGLWRWRTGRQQVVFGERGETEPARFPRSMDLSPTELGRRIVHDALAGRAEGEVTITRIAAQRIAGRVGAGVRIAPTDPASTTITSIDVWADATTGVGLRVEINSGGTVPIFETGFLDLALDVPAAAVLSFDPEETGVVYRVADNMDDAIETLNAVGFPLPDEIAGLERRAAESSGVQTYGSGLSIVSAFAVPRGVLGRRLAALPTSARPWGGDAIVIEADLVNVMIVDAAGFSYVLAGMVPLSVLDAMAGQLTGADGTEPAG